MTKQSANIKEKPIAFFDSGVGGITVFDKLKKILPNEDYIYFGDLKNVPYGEKSHEELLEIAKKIFEFFEKKDVKAVVMACNTTSANIYEDIKNNYNFKIYPIIQSCAKVFAQLPVKKIGVLATAATVKSGAYARELKKHNPDLKVIEQSCPKWVKIVEEGLQNTPESIACSKEYLKEILTHKPDKIILGCTHYPYLLDILTKFAPKELFIDPAACFAEFIKNDLSANDLLNTNKSEGSEEFFVSANPEKFKSSASMFYNLKELPTVI